MTDRTYTVTEDGKRLDQAALAIYGTERGGSVEALLDANPGLAATLPFVPAGTVLVVPEAPDPEPETIVAPWD